MPVLLPPGVGVIGAAFSRQLLRLAVLCSALLTAFPFASRTAQAQDEGIRIVLLPESVALEPGEPVPVQLIVENPGPGEVQNVTLTWFPSQGLQVTARPAALTTLPAGAARVFRGGVEQSGSGMLPAAFGLKWLWKRETVPADVKSAPFWLLAVPLSFLMAAAYPVLPWGQNYLLAYGFKDLVLIWVTSSGLGALVFLVWLTSGA